MHIRRDCLLTILSGRQDLSALTGLLGGLGGGAAGGAPAAGGGNDTTAIYYMSQDILKNKS
jgi:hypothetical protein